MPICDHPPRVLKRPYSPPGRRPEHPVRCAGIESQFAQPCLQLEHLLAVQTRRVGGRRGAQAVRAGDAIGQQTDRQRVQDHAHR